MAEDRYWPSLDGVRGVAIAAVIAFHLGYLGGGWVGVDIFFVLSGFLITSLLLSEQARSGRIRLGAFWGRRARRLLPALALMLVVLALYMLAGGPGLVPSQLRSPALATLLYYANWQQIVAGHGYFASFQAVNPLSHTWSLAVEEQYYLVWPLVFGALVWAGRRRSVRALVIGTALLATASALWMGVAAHLFGPNRAYLGTDTRVWELLLGGLGAMALRSAGSAPTRRPTSWTVATVLAVGGVALGIALGSGPPGWMWDGGLVAVALCVAVVVVGSVRHPEGPVGRLLAVGPLRGLGRISYSLYLWHWPVIVLITTANTGLTGAALLSCRLAAMVGVAAMSYVVVEQPLRRADWSRWWRRALVPASAVAVVGVVLAATVAPVEASTAEVAEPAPARARLNPSTPPITLPPGRVLSASDPLRAWILGDSVMQDSSPGVTAALQATGDVRVVANSSFGGWGLSTDHGWRTDLPQIVHTWHPEMVIGTWSWDDSLAQEHPESYLSELIQALRAILKPGDGVDLVVLLQFPQVGPNPNIIDSSLRQEAWVKQVASQVAWNDVAREAVQFFPGRALYLDTTQLFAPHDRFFAWNRAPDGQWIRTRKLDDTHVCPYGAAELGALVVNDLTPVLGLGPMAPGWQDGGWVHDANYNDPPGACPDDQPPPGYDGVKVPGPPS